MPRDTQPPVKDSTGDEHHPAFGICRIGRLSSHPGASLFQSDVLHQQYVQVTLSRATRKRDLHHDWVHAGGIIAQFDVSMAQFASLITSGGTEGIPVTISYTEAMGPVPGLDYDPRLAHTTTETRQAAHRAYQGIKDALAAFEHAREIKAGAAEQRHLLANLRAAVLNAERNVEFAAKSLNEHAERVVEQARSDIEAMAQLAADRAERQAISHSYFKGSTEIEEGEVL